MVAVPEVLVSVLYAPGLAVGLVQKGAAHTFHSSYLGPSEVLSNAAYTKLWPAFLSEQDRITRAVKVCAEAP